MVSLRLASALVVAVAGLVLALDERLAADSEVKPTDAAAQASAGHDSLPGQVVDVDAGEFFFPAPDSIPSGLTTFRLRQVGMVVDRLKAGVRGRALVADKGADTDVTARISANGTMQFSGAIVAGTRVFRVANTTDQEFEFKFQRVPPGIAGREFLAPPRSAGPGMSWGGLSSVPANSVVLTTIDFEPGAYVVGTWPPIRHETRQVVAVAAPRR